MAKGCYLHVTGARNEQPYHCRLERGAHFIDLPRFLGRYGSDHEHPTMAAFDEAFGLQ
jgi:hypothetical protein